MRAHAAPGVRLNGDSDAGGIDAAARVIADDDGEDLGLCADRPQAFLRGEGHPETADRVVCSDDGELALTSK